MTEPIKINAWAQGLYETSTTKKECLGAKRITEDGREFRYGKAGGTLIAGGATFGVAVTANHVAQAQTSGAANAVGSTNVTVHVGATAVTANQYDDGYLLVHRTTSGTAGMMYPISSHTTSAGSGTITVTLKEPLEVATYTTCYLSLIPNPYSSVVEATEIATSYTGQAFVSCASGSYCWIQTAGLSNTKGGDNATANYPLGPSDTDSCLEVASAQLGPVVGYAYGTALVSGYHTPIMLYSN
jgi:hypothetical protein